LQLHLLVFLAPLIFLKGLTAIIFSINYDCETLNHVTGTCTPPEATQVMEPMVARGEICRHLLLKHLYIIYNKYLVYSTPVVHNSTAVTLIENTILVYSCILT